MISKAHLGTEKPLSIAILAMGGQGGGVLADWVVALAESQDWVAQSTSVPGVAQRTGATIYYIEMLPAKEGVAPVLSLMPTPGDVDLVIAAELMEAGRSVLRGLVTPDRTTLIASTHRSFAVIEKEKPGDGIGDPAVAVAAFDIAARRKIMFDMEALAVENNSVISAALFGALASSEVLPFARQAFEATVRLGGKGIEPSVKTFNLAYDRARTESGDRVTATPNKQVDGLTATTGHPLLDGLIGRIRGEFPESAQTMLLHGVKKLTDFQDPAYAGEYLDQVRALLALDRAQGGESKDFAFTQRAAKYVAVAMAYDDVIRVADLKIRSSRFARVRKEVGAKADQIVHTTEYMHPRLEEVCGTLPRRLGQWIEDHPTFYKRLDHWVNRGRRVRTTTLFWFVGLSLVAGLRGRRRGTLRHFRETESREAWLAQAATILPDNYDLAVEILTCRRLVKGYSDTHLRGQSKFARVMSAVPALAGRPDGAAWLGRLVRAALQDEDGIALDGALKTVSTI